MTDGSRLLEEMCRIPEPKGSDAELVTQALKKYRNLALQHRYGGMGHDHALAKAALEAFERLMTPTLFDFS